MKQLVPTGLDEFLEEHRVGDAVTGRVMSVEDGIAAVELGEGIVATCVLPVEAAIHPHQPPEPRTSPAPEASTGVVDLSAFSSMLKSKWKTGASPSGTASAPPAAKAESLASGQVRSFVIGHIELSAKRIELKLA